MAHNEGPRQKAPNEIFNAVYNPNTSAFRVDLEADAITISAQNTSPDAGLFRVSGIAGDAGLLRVSSIGNDAGNDRTSCFQADAGLFRTSAFESVVTTNTGGTLIYWTSSGATSQVSTVKSAAGRLYGYDIGNAAGVDQYLQIFNASGGATAGTDTPALTIYVPTLKQSQLSINTGIGFSNGIQVIGTSTVNGQTMGASALRVNLYYA